MENLRARADIDWAPIGPVSAAYGVQERCADSLADHLVAPADGQDPRTVIHRLLHGTYRSTVTVIADDGAVWAGLRTHGDRGKEQGITVRITAEPGAEHSALVRGLYAPALFSWFYWWLKQTRQPHTATIPATAKWAVPWPNELELTGPDFPRPPRIRLHNITPARCS